MSTSLNVVNEAAVFCDSFSRSAIRSLILFILTRRSPLDPADAVSAEEDDEEEAAVAAGAAGLGVSFFISAGF